MKRSNYVKVCDKKLVKVNDLSNGSYSEDKNATVCFYHVTYAFQSESTLYSCLYPETLYSCLHSAHLHSTQTKLKTYVCLM